MVPLTGHRLVGVARGARQLAELCRAARPDLVIADRRMAGSLAGLGTPVILVATPDEADLARQAAVRQAVTYVLRPVTVEQLQVAMCVTVLRFEQLCGGGKNPLRRAPRLGYN
jgi:AmiR/NasT family two-component response regulator